MMMAWLGVLQGGDCGKVTMPLNPDLYLNPSRTFTMLLNTNQRLGKGLPKRLDPAYVTRSSC